MQKEIQMQDRGGEGVGCVWGTRRWRLCERREQKVRQESNGEGS